MNPPPSRAFYGDVIVKFSLDAHDDQFSNFIESDHHFQTIKWKDLSIFMIDINFISPIRQHSSTKLSFQFSVITSPFIISWSLNLISNWVGRRSHKLQSATSIPSSAFNPSQHSLHHRIVCSSLKIKPLYVEFWSWKIPKRNGKFSFLIIVLFKSKRIVSSLSADIDVYTEAIYYVDDNH